MNCIKPNNEIKKLTIDDCLSCSGCIDSSSLQIFSPIGLNYYFILSPISLYNIYDYLEKRYNTYSLFEKSLYNFLNQKNIKFINSINFQNFHLEKTFLEIINNKNKGLISSYCPGIVSYIEKIYINLLNKLNKIKGAELLALEYILTKEDNNNKIISVVSCFDKKIEDNKLECITTCQFFDYLKEIGFYINDILINEPFKENKRISFNYINYFIKKIPEEFNKIKLKKDIIEYKSINYNFLRVTGHKNILNILKSYETIGIKYNFIELWVCNSGCFKGPGNFLIKNKIKNIEELNIIPSNNFTVINYKREFDKFKMKKFTFNVEW